VAVCFGEPPLLFGIGRCPQLTDSFAKGERKGQGDGGIFLAHSWLRPGIVIIKG